MKTQNSARNHNQVTYNMNIWEASLSKIPNFGSMDITLSRKSGNYSRGSVYSRNATERQYVWVHGNPHYNVKSAVT